MESVYVSNRIVNFVILTSLLRGHWAPYQRVASVNFNASPHLSDI